MTTEIPEVITADDPNSDLCTDGGMVDHDYRPYRHESQRELRQVSLRCVWCHAVACGDVGEEDPCIEAYHHPGKHRTRRGVTWPLGGNRPDQR